jgi:amino acid transporter
MVLGIALFGLVFCVKRIFSKEKFIPWTLWGFTAIWLAVIVVITIWKIAVCDDPTDQSIGIISLYNSAFIWAIAGLLWIIVYGLQKVRRIARNLEEYLSVMNKEMEE